jgi:hypothetical protein
MSVIAKLLAAGASRLGPLKHRRPTVRILAGYIVEALRNFVTRTPFEQQKFDYGALLCLTSISTFQCAPIENGHTVSCFDAPIFYFSDLDVESCAILACDFACLRRSSTGRVEFP